MVAIDILNYLKRVYELESSLYQQQVLAKRIENEYRRSPQLISTQSTNNKCRLSDNISGGNFGLFAFLGFLIVLVPFSIKFGNVVFSSFSAWLACILPWWAIAFIVLSILYIILMQIKTSNENRLIEEKNNTIRENNNKIIAKNNNIFQKTQIYKENLKREYDYLTRNSIEDTKSALKRIYSCNIIFPKYQRNFVAISSFYEYFSSGRCQTLGEAYNKYEEELRLNLIITKLDTIMLDIEQIKDTQFALYDAISTLNDMNSKILTTVKKVSSQNDYIAHNSDITAYNSSITAQNTEHLKWYTIFKK